jgi:cyclophilin family peptidyl-prolyl cis-trans isomerase
MKRPIWCLALLAGLISGCCLEAQSLALFRTSVGDMLVELYDSDKPVTVQNFKRYAEGGYGYYRDMFFHRWVPGFVIQGGCLWTAYRYTTPQPWYVANFDPIVNEYGVGRTFSNTYGTLAMARLAGAPNSATSQWFFNLTNNAFLDTVDGGFTVFGRVAIGTNVLNRFNIFDPTNGIYRTTLTSTFTEVPILSTQLDLKYLVYVDITVLPALKLQLALKADGSREISWTSLPNYVNRIEYTSAIAPAWQPLLSTNGTGGLVQVVDKAPLRQQRFYRLLIE